jgi:hypothetical protein
MSTTEVWNYANTTIVLPLFPFALADLYTITHCVITMLYVTKGILITHFYGCKTFRKVTKIRNTEYTYIFTI